MKRKFIFLSLGLSLLFGTAVTSCSGVDGEDDVVIEQIPKEKEEEPAPEPEPSEPDNPSNPDPQTPDPTPDEPEEEQLPDPQPLVDLSYDLHVDGRYLKDGSGNIVNLHGMAQTYSPWFNRVNDQYLWNNYDVAGCLRVNQEKLQKIHDAGWCMDFVRLHMDPHWTMKNAPMGTQENSAHKYFDETRFKRYLDEVYVPMAEFMQELGMRVLMRPPGVCPEQIALNDDYHKYMLKVWSIVAQHPKLKNNPNIMFELANEPVKFKASNGQVGASGGTINKELSEFFQSIVDRIRLYGCSNILWVPGTSWQQDYKAYEKYPIKGDNIGYAVHCYPGWYGSDCYQQTGEIAPDMWRGSAGGYEGFKKDWDNSITNGVAKNNPIVVTEMDWCSQKFKGRTWGHSITGEAGGKGFGANFKKIMDETGNVSWLTFVWDHDLAQFDPEHGPDENEFIYDPESGVYPVYQWFKEYREGKTEEDKTEEDNPEEGKTEEE